MTDIPDGEYTAVLDRIEDDLAALEVATDDGPRELAVELTELPEEGRQPDAVLTVEIDNGMLLDADYDPEETGERKEDAQSRFDQLSSRPPSDEESS